MISQRCLALCFSIAAALLLSGCLGYEEEMKINSDLSGEATIKVILPDVVDSKLASVSEEFSEDALRKRFAKATGVTLASYERKDDSRHPEVTVTIKFSSLDALSKAAEANPPAAMLLGKFEVTTDEATGGKRVKRTLGTAAPSEDIKDDSYALYVMHFGKPLAYTNSTRFDGANDTVRFRFKMADMPGKAQDIIAVIPKPDIWKWVAICLGTLAVITLIAWRIYGVKK